MFSWARRTSSKDRFEPRAEEVWVHFLYPDLAERAVDLGVLHYRPFNLDPTERFCVAALASSRSPARIFEFGTYDGATSLLLAQAVPDAEVLTLDLPEEEVALLDPVAHDQLRLAGGTGARFRGRPESDRITQLLGDSRTFDLSGYERSVDFVLVDGGHSYECVRADSENAFRMLAPGGMVIWDDYCPMWPDVARAADEVAARRGVTLRRLLPTELAVYDSRSPG